MEFKLYLPNKDETPDYPVFTAVIQLCIRTAPMYIPYILSHQLLGGAGTPQVVSMQLRQWAD